MSNVRMVHLPADECDRLEQRFGAQFGSLENLLAEVIAELLRDDIGAMDQQEKALIDQRLKDLGYT